ncbi:MAG: AAA family ATPase [Woronichinia naegeliana WA131]|jgi:predicted ATPase|uniref:AAA family ATPase n=1 Tax=Woronichinia naegeliana WA131 TaxID=2824559 RepID=A0A977KTV9_9CYAN|nr:MAG: AAA family ATPase [Woronichinia naegeliana WA131]
MKLISARIRNFKSLEDVTLNFRDLTIIVGANATGKSNCLEALRRFGQIVKAGSPPPSEWLQGIVRNSSSQALTLEIITKADNQDINYQVSISTNDEKVIFSRELLQIGEITVINVHENQGKVYDEDDEDGKNPQDYKSKQGNLALKTAGDYGSKPLTSQLSEFMRTWQFYDFEPRVMRGKRRSFSLILKETQEEIPSLDIDGEYLEQVLLYWKLKHSDKFQEINQELYRCLGISLEVSGNEELRVKEVDGQKIKLSGLSDGTLRIIGYYVLLHQDDLPPLIGIEEPERNLHPAILSSVASILQKLSQRTQIIITTHSSQLLDCFSSDEINSDISVLLLSKKDASGTQVFRLDELSKKREDLAEWMRDFGVGSAVYHSNLLQELLEPQYA